MSWKLTRKHRMLPLFGMNVPRVSTLSFLCQEKTLLKHFWEQLRLGVNQSRPLEVGQVRKKRVRMHCTLLCRNNQSPLSPFLGFICSLGLEQEWFSCDLGKNCRALMLFHPVGFAHKGLWHGAGGWGWDEAARVGFLPGGVPGWAAWRLLPLAPGQRTSASSLPTKGLLAEQ